MTGVSIPACPHTEWVVFNFGTLQRCAQCGAVVVLVPIKSALSTDFIRNKPASG